MRETVRRVQSCLLTALLVGSTAVAEPVGAVEFVISGPRAVGMGGAGVATTTDALATYWNPAGLAMSRDVDVRLQGSAQAVDRGGLLDTLDDIDKININNLTQLNDINALLERLNDTSVSAMASAGLYFKGYAGHHTFGFNISDVVTGGLFVPDRITAAVSGTSLVVNGQLLANALEARQAAFSYAYAFADRTVAVGITGKVIQGAAYSNPVAVFSASNDFNFSSDLGKAEISTDVGIDVGAIIRPAPWIRLGIVGKDLNEPTFDAPRGGKFKLGPQIRAGVAVNPYRSLTLAFDADLTSNKTLVPGVKSQVLSVGLEQTLLFRTLALRAGALKNVQDAKSKITPTAGLGLSLAAFQLDLAGGYDFNQRGALIGASLGLTF